MMGWILQGPVASRLSVGWVLQGPIGSTGDPACSVCLGHGISWTPSLRGPASSTPRCVCVTRHTCGSIRWTPPACSVRLGPGISWTPSLRRPASSTPRCVCVIRHSRGSIKSTPNLLQCDGTSVLFHKGSERVWHEGNRFKHATQDLG